MTIRTPWPNGRLRIFANIIDEKSSRGFPDDTRDVARQTIKNRAEGTETAAEKLVDLMGRECGGMAVNIAFNLALSETVLHDKFV